MCYASKAPLKRGIFEKFTWLRLVRFLKYPSCQEGFWGITHPRPLSYSMLYTIILRPGFGHILHFNAKSDFTKQLQFDCFKKANLHCVGVYSWYCPQQGKGGGWMAEKWNFAQFPRFFNWGVAKNLRFSGYCFRWAMAEKLPNSKNIHSCFIVRKML